MPPRAAIPGQRAAGGTRFESRSRASPSEGARRRERLDGIDSCVDASCSSGVNVAHRRGAAYTHTAWPALTQQTDYSTPSQPVEVTGWSRLARPMRSRGSGWSGKEHSRYQRVPSGRGRFQEFHSRRSGRVGWPDAAGWLDAATSCMPCSFGLPPPEVRAMCSV
jgi:hypothetical protein